MAGGSGWRQYGGAFISREKKGAQDERNIIPCDVAICRRFLDASEGLVRFVGVASECSGDALEFIRQMKDEVNISLAHTNADYEKAVQKMRIPLETAVACATKRPAKSLGIYEEYGSITPGKKGNVVLLDEKLQIKAVIKDGVRIR